MKAVVNPERCKACALCMENCPRGALEPGAEMNDDGYRAVAVREEKCVGCGICYTVCPDGALSIL